MVRRRSPTAASSMSTKAKSKPGSAASPAPGSPSGPGGSSGPNGSSAAGKPSKEGEPAAAAKSEAKAEEREGRGESVTVYLSSDRSRRVSWMLAGCVLGGLLLWKFGTVAAGLGVLLLVLGLYHGWF